MTRTAIQSQPKRLKKKEKKNLFCHIAVLLQMRFYRSALLIDLFISDPSPIMLCHSTDSEPLASSQTVYSDARIEMMHCYY